MHKASLGIVSIVFVLSMNLALPCRFWISYDNQSSRKKSSHSVEKDVKQCTHKEAMCENSLQIRSNTTIYILSMLCCVENKHSFEKLRFYCTPTMYAVPDRINFGTISKHPRCLDCCFNEEFTVQGKTFSGLFCHCLDSVWDHMMTERDDDPDLD